MRYREHPISCIELFKVGNKLILKTNSSQFDVTKVPYQRTISWENENVKEVFTEISELSHINAKRSTKRDRTMPKMIILDDRAYDSSQVNSVTIDLLDGQQRDTFFELLFKAFLVHIEKNFPQNERCKKIADELKECLYIKRGNRTFPKIRLFSNAENNCEDLNILIAGSEKDRLQHLKDNKGLKEHRVCELYKTIAKLIKQEITTEDDAFRFFEYGLNHYKVGIQYVETDEERNEVFAQTNDDKSVSLTETQLSHNKLSVTVSEKVNNSTTITSTEKNTISRYLGVIKSHQSIDWFEALYFAGYEVDDKCRTVLPYSLSKKDRTKFTEQYIKNVRRGTTEDVITFCKRVSNAILDVERFNDSNTGMTGFDKYLPLCPNTTERSTNLIIYRELFDKRSTLLGQSSKTRFLDVTYSLKCISRVMKISFSVSRFNQKLFEFLQEADYSDGKSFIEEYIHCLEGWEETKPIMRVTEDEFINALETYSFNLNNSIEKNTIRTLLIRINYLISSNKTIVNPKDITIEHIISQVDNGTKLPDRYINAIGNLTLLTGNENSSASKLPYSSKLSQHYKNSQIEMTRALTSADNPSTEEANRKRGRALGEIIWKSFNRN